MSLFKSQHGTRAPSKKYRTILFCLFLFLTTFLRYCCFLKSWLFHLCRFLTRVRICLWFLFFLLSIYYHFWLHLNTNDTIFGTLRPSIIFTLVIPKLELHITQVNPTIVVTKGVRCFAFSAFGTSTWSEELQLLLRRYVAMLTTTVTTIIFLAILMAGIRTII